MSWKDDIASVENMGKEWEISPHYLKILCQKGKVDCKKVGKTWVLYKHQRRPDINHYNWTNKK